MELFASTDSDHTDVVKLLGRGAILDAGPDRYFGVAIEQAWFSPLGQKTRKDQRVYADLAGKAGKDWLWKARLGTDGKTWLGSANLRSKDWSKEVFLEREIIETPRGVDEGLYYTFLGASFDVPVAKDTLTFTGAVQAFTGGTKGFTHGRVMSTSSRRTLAQCPAADPFFSFHGAWRV
ncbi:hypothetical protein [Sphingomonas daechungensis]|uniref:hypothetical protein n=1 Tax=Sphingomonas daechungensis TaxID=1176646 RepID=UPI001CB98D93|nr:hypothetical protein [Sphingomonas daechungensis]